MSEPVSSKAEGPAIQFGPHPEQKPAQDNDEKYTVERCALCNRQCCEGGTGFLKPLLTRHGWCATYFSCKWSESDKKAFKEKGTPPVTQQNCAPDQLVLVIKFAQIKLRSQRFPGYADDLGRPLNFMDVGTDLHMVYVLEDVDVKKENDSALKVVFMIPGSELDTPHRKMVNEEFLRTKESKVNPLVLRNSWNRFASDVSGLF